MADLSDYSRNVSIHNEATDVAVTTTTDTETGKERLDVAIQNDADFLGHLHKKVHDGDFFSSSDIRTYNKGVNWDLIVSVGTITPHILFDVACTVGIEVYIYEAPTYTGGTSKSVLDHNRVTANTATVSVLDGATVTAVGTLLTVLLIPGSNQSGGAFGASIEWIFDENTDYLVRISSNNNSNRVQYNFNWYEENV